MVKLYVEGGGDSKALKTACRKGFADFLDKTAVSSKPRIVACGGRRDAYEAYCVAVENGDDAILLVDSETPVDARYQRGDSNSWQPWEHVKQRQGDGWDKPSNAVDTDCHLMVQCMESWFLADRENLNSFFGQGFQKNKLPATSRSVEGIAKSEIYKVLAEATKNCKTKAQYGKGEHSFKLLAHITPDRVTNASPWAKRFVDELKKKMGESGTQ